MQIDHSFCSTVMVGLGNAALGLERALDELQEEQWTHEPELQAAVARVEESLMKVLVKIVKEEQFGLHRQEERVVLTSRRGPYYELQLYTAFIRIPLLWLARNNSKFAWKLARRHDGIYGFLIALPSVST